MSKFIPTAASAPVNHVKYICTSKKERVITAIYQYCMWKEFIYSLISILSYLLLILEFVVNPRTPLLLLRSTRLRITCVAILEGIYIQLIVYPMNLIYSENIKQIYKNEAIS